MNTPTATSPFSWLRRSRAPLDVLLSPVSATAFSERMLETDRTTAAQKMVTRIGEVLDGVFAEVYAEVPGNRVHLLRTGTGTGKTSHTLSYIAEDPRTYAWDGRQDEEGYPGPNVFLLPTYANIHELRAKAAFLGLNPRLSGKRLLAQARSRGIIHEADIDAYVAAMADKRLNTVIYKGKVAAGCRRAGEVTALQDAGLPTSRLCRSQGLHGGVSSERLCPFYDTCRAIAQRQDIQNAHVVFAPRSFLDLRLPDELERCRLVIADEAVWTLLVHSETFPLAALDLRRDPPRLSHHDQKAGMSAEEMLGQRDLAVPVVKAALLAGQDPATALLEHAVDVPGHGLVRGILAQSARFAAIVTNSAAVDRSQIQPLLTPAAIARICAQPIGEHIKGEGRLWGSIADRIDGIINEECAGPDVRLQLLAGNTDQPQVRVAWLSEANWGDAPMLMLDASGDAEITARVFPGREIAVHDIPVSFNMRTLACIDKRFAIRNVCPGSGATPQQLFDAAKLLHEIRCVISAICGVHAHGRVLIGMPKKIRKAIQKAWMAPSNADFLHSGAEAGLDFARQHVAVVSIGRLELPIAEIDSQVAALTGDDQLPESPIDILGTGVDEDGMGIYPNIVTRTLRMRDGSDLHYHAHEHAGAMAARVQRQHREEKILQLIGRLRAFYRTDTTDCYIIGQAIPEDIIVDEVCTWSDLIGSGAGMWDVARQAGGLLSPILMHRASSENGTVARYQAWIDGLSEIVCDSYHGVLMDLDVGGGVHAVGVPGHAEDIMGFINAVPGTEGAADMDGIGWCQITAPAAPGGRPDDDIEIRLGDRADRRAEERACLAAVKSVVQRRGEWRPGARAYRAGWDELKMFKAPLGVWAAMATLQDVWIYRDDAVEAPETRVFRVA